MPKILKNIVAGLFYYAEQNGSLKILTGCVEEMVGEGGGSLSSNHLLTIKKITSPFNFLSNHPF